MRFGRIIDLSPKAPTSHLLADFFIVTSQPNGPSSCCAVVTSYWNDVKRTTWSTHALNLAKGQLTFRQRPDIAPVGRLLHYDVTIKWPVKWLHNCDVTVEWRQKTIWSSTCPEFGERAIVSWMRGNLQPWLISPVGRKTVYCLDFSICSLQQANTYA